MQPTAVAGSEGGPSALEQLLDATLRLSPAQPFMRWRASRRLVVLAYHGVPDPESFERQIGHLARCHHPISLDEVLRATATGGGLPRRAVLVTFDDGERSVYENALPVLRRHGVPAVVFAISGLIDTCEPFWWVEAETLARRGATAPGLPPLSPAGVVRMLKRVPDARRLEVLEQLRLSAGGEPLRTPQLRRAELASLQSAGVAIGSHTLTHPCLDRCPDEKVEEEVVGAHEALSGLLGAEPRAFAYPNGNHDERAARALRRLGYGAAFLFDHRIGSPAPRDPLRISRVRVNATDRLDRFRVLVSGLHPAIHHAIGRH